MKILVSPQPLYMIVQIMRILMNNFNFLIIAVVVSLLLHSITVLIHLLLIFLSHQSLMVYPLTKWKHLKILRHFIPSQWLCQILIVLMSVLLSIKNLLRQLRLLITLLFALKINLVYRFHILDVNHMIISLIHWRNHTQ